MADCAAFASPCWKCGAESGDGWKQCGGACPLPISPYWNPYHKDVVASATHRLWQYQVRARNQGLRVVTWADLDNTELVARRVIQSLQGTCSDIEKELGPHERSFINDKEFCDAIDQEIFRCAQCEWWCENSEANECHITGEDICNDCHGEDDD